MSNKNKTTFTSCRPGGKDDKLTLTRHKFSRMTDEEVYLKTKDIFINGTELKGAGKCQWRSFNGVLEHIELTEKYEGKYQTLDNLTVSKEFIAKQLNIKKKQVSIAFTRLNQEGWVCTRPVDPRIPMHRGDGNSWRANSYKIRIDNILQKGLI